MRPLEYRIMQTAPNQRLKTRLVDIAIFGATGKMTSNMLRCAKNSLDRHRRQAEKSITGVISVCNRGRYRGYA